MPLTDAPAAEDLREDPGEIAPGPPKPAGVPGKFVVVGVVVGCVVITAGFLAVKFTRGDPGERNRATLLFTEGLGAMERYSQRTAAADRFREAGETGQADEQMTLREEELAAAEQAFEQSASSRFGPPMATGWLAEVKRRRGDAGEAVRLFTRAIEGPADAVITDPGAEADRRADFTPDPADLGGRALALAELGDAPRAVADARRSLDLFAAGAKTRATNQFAEFGPDPNALARLAAGGE